MSLKILMNKYILFVFTFAVLFLRPGPQMESQDPQGPQDENWTEH